MGFPICNSTLIQQTIIEDPLFSKVTVHHVLLAISLLTMFIAVITSLCSIFAHCGRYSKSGEQKQIIRILFMVPLYAIASFLSALYYKQFAYFQIIGDTYAAIAITSFFALLCHYVGGTSEDQEAFFRDLVPGDWALYIFGFSIPLPVHWVCGKNMAKPSGSRWFKVVSYGVYQYAVVRILMAIVSVITQATDRYCPGSSSPAFAHLWVNLDHQYLARTNIFNALSATIAQFFLDQFFHETCDQFPDHRPTFKFWCVKSILIFSQYQTVCSSLDPRAFIERIDNH
ncbi:hypothetical protein D6D03_03691 [Aureobasidium pullulans]|nr:hypothetical protein D6D03_03691 [Aureobasidium pullulans]